jgi:thiamine biosynthesis lipoprotein
MNPVEARIARFAAMGTRVELHLFGGGDPRSLAQARAAIMAVDDALTIRRPSATTLLNQSLAAGMGASVDDPILFEALLAVAEAWNETGGLFDPSMGQWAALTIDRATRRVSPACPLTLDFGGIGKGFALDRGGAVLRAGGVTSALLSAGESSIAVIGQHPLGGAWPLAVPHPDHADISLVELELCDASLSISSTSGAGARKPGRAQMVRPTDAVIVSAPATAIAVADTGALAEAWSTALLVADAATSERMQAATPGRRFRFSHAAPECAEPVLGLTA